MARSIPHGLGVEYTVAFLPNGGAAMTRLGYSANGIDWSLYNNGNPVTGRAADFSNQIFWDPRKRRYLLLARQDFAAGGGVGELRGVPWRRRPVLRSQGAGRHKAII